MNINNLVGNSSAMNIATERAKSLSDDKFKSQLDSAVKNNDEEQLKEVCKEFETYFMKELMKNMKNTLGGNELIPKGKGEEIFSDMLDDKYSEKAADAGGVGIAKMMFEQLKGHVNNKL